MNELKEEIINELIERINRMNTSYKERISLKKEIK